MRTSLALAFVVCAEAFCAAAFAADNPALTAVYQRMDRAAATCKGFTADVVKIDYQDFVDATDKSTGTVAMRKTGPHNVQVLEKIDTLNGNPDPQQTEFNGSEVTLYHPKQNTATQYEVGKKYRGIEESMLSIMCGSSADLQRDYKVTYGGADSVNGQPAARLELNPIDPELARNFPKVELWISDSSGTVVQQKFYEPGQKSYHLFTYSKMKFGPVSEDQVKMKLPNGVKKERQR